MRSATAINRILRAREWEAGPWSEPDQGLRCQFCGRRFALRAELLQHINAHAGGPFWSSTALAEWVHSGRIFLTKRELLIGYFRAN
jgi:hypothetical protein